MAPANAPSDAEMVNAAPGRAPPPGSTRQARRRLPTGRSKAIVVTSPQGACRKVVPRAALDHLSRTIEIDSAIGRDGLLSLLTAAGYGRSPVVEDPGRAAAIERMHDAFARKESTRLEVYLHADGPDSEELRRMDTAYAMTRLALEGVRAWCDQRDVALGVLLIPDVIQVDQRLRARVLGGVGLAESDLDWTRPQRTLVGWCEELDLPVLDLLPAMAKRQATLRAAGDPTDMGLYLFGDSHWSAAGHAFAAAALLEAWRAGAFGAAFELELPDLE